MKTIHLFTSIFFITISLSRTPTITWYKIFRVFNLQVGNEFALSETLAKRYLIELKTQQKKIESFSKWLSSSCFSTSNRYSFLANFCHLISISDVCQFSSSYRTWLFQQLQKTSNFLNVHYLNYKLIALKKAISDAFRLNLPVLTTAKYN